MSVPEIIITVVIGFFFAVNLWVWAMTSPNPSSFFSSDAKEVLKNWKWRAGAFLASGLYFLLFGWYVAAGLAFATVLCIVLAVRTAKKAIIAKEAHDQQLVERN